MIHRDLPLAHARSPLYLVPADIASAGVGAHLGNKYLKDISLKTPSFLQKVRVPGNIHLGKSNIGQFIGMGIVNQFPDSHFLRTLHLRIHFS